MAIDRSVTAVNAVPQRGENVWAMLCQAALRGIEWAADACGARDASERIERTELLVEHGTTPLVAPCPVPYEAALWVDWAQLGDMDRASVAQVLGSGDRQLLRRW